jgi:putative ubiquitin-RnfH superfamily antitoxin RatB of RatAB toxin-antitoxin module
VELSSVIPAEAGIQVEVAYAGPEPVVVLISVPPGTTLRQAIARAGLLERFPEIDLARCGVGVFGQTRGLDEPVASGDRVEIYRPLLQDPKERRRRAARR